MEIYSKFKWRHRMFRIFRDFSIVRFIAIIIIIALIISVAIPAYKYFSLNKEISKADENATAVFSGAEEWIQNAQNKNTSLTSTTTGSKLIYKSENVNSKKSDISYDNNYVSMDLTNYISESFHGFWVVVVDAKTFKIDYALWCAKVISDSDLNEIDILSSQKQKFESTEIIGYSPNNFE